MKVHAIITALVTGLVGLATASAQTTVTGADILVDLDQLAGQQVILTDVEVWGAKTAPGLSYRLTVQFACW